jgi:hypothetical protein
MDEMQKKSSFSLGLSDDDIYKDEGYRGYLDITPADQISKSHTATPWNIAQSVRAMT